MGPLIKAKSFIRGFDVPATEVELDHGDKTLDRVIDVWHGKESVGMGHEARAPVSCGKDISASECELRYSLKHRSFLQDERR
jgi:hypothetical protein